MTDVAREESESGKFSTWTHIKNWISDYLKPTDLDIDVNKYLSVNVKNHPADFPDSYVGTQLDLITTLIDELVAFSDLNIDGSKNVGVNVQNHPADYPDAAVLAALAYLHTELEHKLQTNQLNIDGSKNVGVNVKTVTEEDPDAATKNNPITTFTYNGDGQLTHIAITFNVTIWVKTLSYASGRLSAISAWVKQ